MRRSTFVALLTLITCAEQGLTPSAQAQEGVAPCGQAPFIKFIPADSSEQPPLPSPAPAPTRPASGPSSQWDSAPPVQQVHRLYPANAPVLMPAQGGSVFRPAPNAPFVSSPPPVNTDPSSAIAPEGGVRVYVPTPAAPDGGAAHLQPPPLVPRGAVPVPPAATLPAPMVSHERAPLAWRARAHELSGSLRGTRPSGVVVSHDFKAMPDATLNALARACEQLGYKVEAASDTSKQMAVRCAPGDHVLVILVVEANGPGDTTVVGGLFPDSRSSRAQSISDILARADSILLTRDLL